VIHLSRGGASVRADLEATEYVQIDDLVGIRFRFGQGPSPREIVVDARFRHAEPDGQMAILGFEFVDLEESQQARADLEALREIAEELRLAGRA
jgi:hypothetical protein